MSHEMIPSGGLPGGGALAPLGNTPKGIVAPTLDMMGAGGGGFSETWAINKDKHVFVNKKTNEERRELYVIIEESHPSRALFPKQGPQKGERVCWSDDGKASHNGIECSSCPRVSESDAFNKFYEAHPNVQRPQFIGDCSLRYSLYWTREFIVNQDGSVTQQVRKERVLLNAPKSSIYAIFGRGAYKSKLDAKALDITKVVTKITIAQRENKEMKSVYDYADFELVGTIEEILPRVSKTIEIEASSAAPSSAPAASFPGGGQAALPSMAGQPPVTAGFPTSTGFPPAAAAPAMTGFPPAAPAAPGFPAAAAPSAPGFPAPAQAPGFPAAAPAAAAPAAAAPGFPGAVPPPQAAAPAAAPAAPAPSFHDMARGQVIQGYNALGADVQKVVLSVLGITDINQVPNEKLNQALQAVNQAKSFSAPAPAGAGAGNPF